MTTSDELERLARARVLGLSVTIRDKAGGLRSEHRGTFGETRMSNADIARGYLRRGWCPMPVQFKSK